MVKYFSEKFFRQIEESLNSNEQFAESVRDLETTILLVSEDPDISFLLSITDGKASVAKASPDEAAEFKLIAPYDEWVGTAKGEESLTRLVMSGKMKFKGSMSKMMFYMPKLRGIEDALKEIQKEF
ncbi:MAG: SCP2 sterol-binding domain-containing protein [Candidatus Geothermarchaeales archaeon]